MSEGKDQGSTYESQGLGYHAIERYERTRQAVEAMVDDKIDHALFGLLLSAESVRDEMHVYETETSLLLRLAHTGFYVQRIERLHVVLDAMTSQYEIPEPPDMSEWKSALELERHERVLWYEAMLEAHSSHGADECILNESSCELLNNLETAERQEEALTLLKVVVAKYGEDVLLDEEIAVITQLFTAVTEKSNIIVMEMPPWLVLPFEFKSVFGSSRWGNDVYYPDHLDTERLVHDANVWSVLNHPHVAKFLGACHVGSRPFIVHERARPLVDCVSEAKSRDQVWHLVYEVALALQYLHERSLDNGQNLSLESVFCAEFEAKAMVFGTNLVSTETNPRVAGGSNLIPEDFARDLNPANSAIERLCVLLVNCLHEFSSPTSSMSISLQKHCDVVEEDEAMRYESMPTTRPDFIYQSEWLVLASILDSSTSSKTPILLTIDRLKEVAGVQERSESSVCSFDILDSKATIGSAILPSIGNRTIDAALRLCSKLIPDEDSSNVIYLRLMDVYEQIKELRVQTMDAVQQKLLVEAFASVVVKLYHHLDQSTSSNSSMQWSVTSIPQREDHRAILSLHTSMDRLLLRHNLSSSNKVHRWKPDWTTGSNYALGTIRANLKRRGQELDWNVSPSDSSYDVNPEGMSSKLESSKLMTDKMFASSEDNYAHHPDFLQSTLKKWFVSPTEIEFESFDEFSRGAFGSVHHGKWFDTPVVVKSLLLEAGDQQDLYAQFLQEADTWFELNHINVVKMYGACHIGEPFFVCEYASNGDLGSYLSKNKGSMYEVWYSLLNVALGLQYLHDKGIVHADLKSNNILVGGDGIAKLADFGLSKSGRSGSSDVNGGGARGAYRWKAPECLPWKGESGQSATFASDVYSFAMLMIEVTCGAVPWGEIPDIVVVREVKKGKLPSRPLEIADSEWELIRQMCCLDPVERVTIDAVVVHLTSLLERMDMGQLWSPVDGALSQNLNLNRFVSRGGALMSVMKFAKGSNTRLAKYAADHLITVHIKRCAKSDTKEIDAIIDLVKRGSDSEKEWAAKALAGLAIRNATNWKEISSRGVVDPLVVLLRDGNEMQKANAAMALQQLVLYAPNQVKQAIEPLVNLLRSGNDLQKNHAVVTLTNVALNAENESEIVRAGGVDVLIALTENGNDLQRQYAAGALMNLALNYTSQSDISLSGAISSLVALVHDGNDTQKEIAAGALGNIAIKAVNKEKIASMGGIQPLVLLVENGNGDQKWHAAKALANLAGLADNHAKIALYGGVGALVTLMQKGNTLEKQYALQALWNLSVSDPNKIEIASRGAICALVEFVRNGNHMEKTKTLDSMRKSFAVVDSQIKIKATENIALLTPLMYEEIDIQLATIGTLINLAQIPQYQVEIASHGGIEPLVALTRDGSHAQKAKAACALWNLAANTDNQVKIASCGGIKPLVALVRDGNDDQKTNAVSALWNLAVNTDNQVKIASCGGIEPLVALVRDGNDEQKSKAAGALVKLALVPDNRVEIASCYGIEPLVALVRDGNDDQKTKAASALWNLAVNMDNQVKIASCGGIESLVALVRDGNDDQIESAAGVLWNLAANTDNQVKIASCGGIEPLVALVRDGNDNQKTNAASTLWNLAVNTDNQVKIASCGGIESLVALVRDGNDDQKTKAASALSNLAENTDNQVKIASCGGIKPLVALVRDGNDEQKSKSASALWDLAVNDDNKMTIASCGGIESLVALLRDGNDIHKENAAGALWNLAANDNNQVTISSCGGIELLVTLVRDGNDNQKEKAAGALWNLAVNTDNQVKIASCGGIESLVALVRDGNDDQKTKAASALSNLAENTDNQVKIASCGGIKPLVALVRDGNDDQKTKAASALWNLAVNMDNQVKIASCGGIEPLVALVRDGNDDQIENAAGVLWNLSFDNVDGVATIRECGAMDPLLRIVKNGTEEQKLSAAGVLGFLGPDDTIKTTVATHGGIHALLQYIYYADDDSEREEGLVALQAYCGNSGSEESSTEIAHNSSTSIGANANASTSASNKPVFKSLLAANGVKILSDVVANRSDNVQSLAKDILSSVCGNSG